MPNEYRHTASQEAGAHLTRNPTGNANGGVVKYANNYCASQMARDGKTGELIWAYNITPQDAWDLDEPLITPLIDVNVGGAAKKAAVKFSRMGYMYLWDRATGCRRHLARPAPGSSSSTRVATSI